MEKVKKILVTGGAGFIGTHLCRRLVENGNEVISLDNYFTGQKDNHVPGVEYREGHTKDIKSIVPEKIDIVFHLGEYSRVEQSLEEPELVWDLNVAGTFAVAEYCRENNIRLVYAGSSTRFSDNGLGGNLSPYAFSKMVHSELIKNYGAWYNLPYAITYFYNVYGPGERSGRYGTVIEIFHQQYLKKQPLSVTAPGTQVRIFTHVEDIVDGLVLIGGQDVSGEFGLGADESYSILEVAKMFKTDINMSPERQGNRLGAEIDSSRSKALGWTPKHRLEDYIKGFIS